MSKQTEALKLALEALEENRLLVNGDDKKGGLVFCMDGYYSGSFDIEPVNKQTTEAINAIREALAEQPAPVAPPHEQHEQVAWHHPECEGECLACLIEGVVQASYGSQGLGYLQRHLTSTPANANAGKPWVQATTWRGLTDEERRETINRAWNEYVRGEGHDSFSWCSSQAIEAKLKEKNHE